MLNVFEDGSLKKADSIQIIDELLKLKKLYQQDAPTTENNTS